MATEQNEEIPNEESMMETETKANIVDEDDEGDDDDELACNFCTFAVTGGVPSFQPIFICHQCLNENTSDHQPLCICQACADICHDNNDHDVEYIGMGPCYCDCDHVGNCTIYQKSLIEAERLGAVQALVPRKPAEKSDAIDRAPTAYTQDVYQISNLQDPAVTNMLIEQAQELIKHTKDSHWVEARNSGNELCPFERLAWSLYQRHQKHYESLQAGTGNGGAEWWIQVKPITSESSQSAIDLHYDKDEALAETFGIGSFPTLSTVTYLTASPKTAAPTIVFDHTYSQGEDEVIANMLVSRPRLGKHLVFDGTLLHGAPSDPLLKVIDSEDVKENSSNSDKPMVDVVGGDEKFVQDEQPSIRVTFLINLWRDRRPANVQQLEDSIRQKLFALPQPSLDSPLIMTDQTITKVILNKEEELPETLRRRIELPFVTKGITCEDPLTMEDDDDADLVVITFPPPLIDDTVLVTFGPGLQAYIDYPQHQQIPKEAQGGKEHEQENGYV